MSDALTLRPANDGDWETVLQLADVAVPFDPAGNRYWLQKRQAVDPRLRHHYVAVRDGRVTGYGALEQQGGNTERLRTFIVAAPQDLAGAGELLLAQLVRDAQALGATTLWAREYAQDTALLDFLGAHDFVERSRLWEQRLDPAAARLEPFQPRLDELVAEGFTVTTLADLQQEENTALEKLHQLLKEPEPAVLPEAFFVARHTDEDGYVGYAFLMPDDRPGRLIHGGIRMRRGYGRRGLTLLLRVQCIHYARQHNLQLVDYVDDQAFTLLALNDKLGYEWAYCYINLERQL